MLILFWVYVFFHKLLQNVVLEEMLARIFRLSGFSENALILRQLMKTFLGEIFYKRVSTVIFLFLYPYSHVDISATFCKNQR